MASIVSAFVCTAVFRAPATAVRDGDELIAVSWMMAETLGPGYWEIFPMSFTISFDEGSVISAVSGCGSTSSPGRHQDQSIPVPVVYLQSGDIVLIQFDRIPENAETP
jgi:hypothetical protein